MNERLRDENINFRVTSYEKDIIMHNFEETGIRTFQEFATKMLIDGFVVKIDTSELHKYTYELNKIGVNINQIAHRINSIDSTAPDFFLLKKDIEEVQFLMKELTKLVRRHWIK